MTQSRRHFPLVPAPAGIQKENAVLRINPLGPRFRGDERLIQADRLASCSLADELLAGAAEAEFLADID
jgi:hypothetical protein